MFKLCLVLVIISLFYVYVEILRIFKFFIIVFCKNFICFLNENDFFRRILMDLLLFCFYEYCKYIEIFVCFYWRCKIKFVFYDLYLNKGMIYIG